MEISFTRINMKDDWILLFIERFTLIKVGVYPLIITYDKCNVSDKK